MEPDPIEMNFLSINKKKQNKTNKQTDRRDFGYKVQDRAVKAKSPWTSIRKHRLYSKIALIHSLNSLTYVGIAGDSTTATGAVLVRSLGKKGYNRGILARVGEVCARRRQTDRQTDRRCNIFIVRQFT